MRYDAILLDMDGTVLNTIEDLADAMNAALRHFGMPERSPSTPPPCAAR